MESKLQHTISRWETLTKTLGENPNSRFIVHNVESGSKAMNDALVRFISISDAVVFSCCQEGSVSVMINGVSQTISKGQLCILLPEVYCQFRDVSADYRARVLYMRVDLSAGGTPLIEVFPRLAYNSVFTLDEQERATLLSLTDYIDASVRCPNMIHGTDIEIILSSLLKMEIANLFAKRNCPSMEMSVDEKIVFKFNTLLATKASEHRDVEWYAQQFNLAPKRFAQKVKNVVGRTPSDMITASVIRAAKHLLAATSFSSADISEKLNFATPSFFCRYFKRYVGVAPQEWREMQATKQSERDCE